MAKPAFTQTQFIEKARTIHGDKYDYSLVSYRITYDIIELICHVHGNFTLVADRHMRGDGCPRCSSILSGLSHRASTGLKFISKANKVHNNCYNYSKTVYVKSTEKVIITCQSHGDFTQTPAEHLNLRNGITTGCPKCGFNRSSIKKALPYNIFISKANKIHNNKYTYIESTYVNTISKVDIVCSTHGIFKQTASSHMEGSNCPKCAKLIRINTPSRTTEDFINACNIIHNNKYDYSLVSYIDCRFNIDIICPTHGLFKQRASGHLSGHGCKKCIHLISKWEQEVQAIVYKKYTDTIFNDRVVLRGYEMDLYIPSINTAIECAGDYWHCNPKKYKADYINRYKKLPASEIWKIDAKKHALITELGINLIVLWESEWKIIKRMYNIDGTNIALNAFLTMLETSNNNTNTCTRDNWNSILNKYTKIKTNHAKDDVVYNNGIHQIWVGSKDNIPIGYIKGLLRSDNRRPYHNGVIQLWSHPSNVPNGYISGYLPEIALKNKTASINRQKRLVRIKNNTF